MFDIEKAREKGLDERTVAILEKMNVNSIREKSCDGHVFERSETNRPGRYICKKCGCSEDATWISGYNRGIEHTKADTEKYKLALFAVIRNSKVLPKGLILGKSATEINKMSRETTAFSCIPSSTDSGYPPPLRSGQPGLSRIRRQASASPAPSLTLLSPLPLLYSRHRRNHHI